MASVMTCIASFDKASLTHAETKETDLCTFLGIKKPKFVVVDENAMSTMYAHVDHTDASSASEAGAEQYLEAPSAMRHGHAFPDQSAIGPVLVNYCNEDARPGYDTRKAHEYRDTPEVLAAKVQHLAHLIRESNACVAYTGAGISTASGIDDYASRANKGETEASRPKLLSMKDAEPTLAHRVLTQLHHEGALHGWIQQNHDGLPQKAGMPQHAINEIHGAWYDPSNPVVAMSGSLRHDYFQQLLEWEDSCDLCLAIGTSLAGMNADRVVETVGRRAVGGMAGKLGAVIISIQETRLDDVAALRIFAPIDEVAAMLAEALAMAVPEYIPYEPDVPQEMRECEVYQIPYHSKTGARLADDHGSAEPGGATMTALDLRVGAEVKLTNGPHAGSIGRVTGKDHMGHYNILVKVKVKGSFYSPWPMTMGSWWVEGAVKGLLESMCVVPHTGSTDPSFFDGAKKYAHIMRKAALGISRDALLADVAAEALEEATLDYLLQRREQHAEAEAADNAGQEAAEEAVSSASRHQALIERVAGWLQERAVAA